MPVGVPTPGLAAATVAVNVTVWPLDRGVERRGQAGRRARRAHLALKLVRPDIDRAIERCGLKIKSTLVEKRGGVFVVAGVQGRAAG